jgi:DNA-binding NarL/FixJ family response regulator
MEDEELRHDIQMLTAAPGSPPIIIVSDIEDSSRILEAFEAGVRGYLPTTSAFEIAIEAVRLVEAGGAYIPATSFLPLYRDLEQTKAPESASKVEGFTSRQTAVLKALREGKANKRIAYDLNMCESTVKVHVRNIIKKLNARNRTEVTFKTIDLFEVKKASIRSRFP